MVERKPDCPQGSTMLCFSLALSVFGIFCSELYKQKKSSAAASEAFPRGGTASRG